MDGQQADHVTRVQTVLEFMRASAISTGGVDMTQARAMMEDALARAPSLTARDATTILGALNQSAFSLEDRGHFGRIVNTKITLGPQVAPAAGGRGTERQKGQVCFTFFNFLTEELWQLLQNGSTTWAQVRGAQPYRHAHSVKLPRFPPPPPPPPAGPPPR